jgi:hypothetical protein
MRSCLSFREWRLLIGTLVLGDLRRGVLARSRSVRGHVLGIQRTRWPAPGRSLIPHRADRFDAARNTFQVVPDPGLIKVGCSRGEALLDRVCGSGRTRRASPESPSLTPATLPVCRQLEGVSVNPSSSHPFTPPIIIFTGTPRRARRTAALLAPLQCGPAQ